MNIAVFDLQPHEKKLFQALAPKHRLTFFKETVNQLKLKALKDTEILSVFVNSQINQEIINQLPKLKLIAARSTGYDNIDLKVCKKRKITVCNVPTYGENTVAEHAFALLLALYRKLPQAMVMQQKNKFFSDELKGLDLHSKTIGVIGAGRIGKNVIKIAHGFGMEILTHDINQDKLLAEILDFKYVDLKKLLQKSDIVTLHTPYNKSTHHLINRQNLLLMKNHSVLINTSRGNVVDTRALYLTLKNREIAGAGLDVLEDETVIIKNRQPQAAQKELYDLNKKIIGLPNVIFTPHIAFNTTEAVMRITETTIENIISYNLGHIINAVQ